MMNTRQARVVLAAVLLVTLAGCLGGLTEEGIDEGRLDDPAEYEWDANATAFIMVEDDGYYAVYDLKGETTFELSTEGFEQDQPREIWAVRYRYPNGTEVAGSELEIEEGSTATVITVPDGRGKLAFAGATRQKEVSIPGIVEGSYRVVLPPGYRVGNFFLSEVQPSNDAITVNDDRQVLIWSENTDTIYIQYHLQRDDYLFWGAIGIGLAVLIGGTAYYRRKIRQLRERRRRLGLDVEQDDDQRPPRD